VALTASASGATTFTWYRNGEQVQNGPSTAYTVRSSGTYSVQGKNDNCTGTNSSTKSVSIICCDCVPSCTGVTLYQTTAASDGATTTDWYVAEKYCSDNGARLPSDTEMMCMCRNLVEVPGGLKAIQHYWTSTDTPVDAAGNKAVMCDPNNVYTTNFSKVASRAYYRCVK
jgi:hypothetical protein